MLANTHALFYNVLDFPQAGTKVSNCASQVVAEFFGPDAGAERRCAGRDGRVQARLNNIRDAIAVAQWADALPHILETIRIYGLDKCQDATFGHIQELADDKLALHNLGSLMFQEAASILAEIRGWCGELSGAEKTLFKMVNACSAFWRFIKQEKFYGM